jgi:hypothetical protein
LKNHSTGSCSCRPLIPEEKATLQPCASCSSETPADGETTGQRDRSLNGRGRCFEFDGNAPEEEANDGVAVSSPVPLIRRLPERFGSNLEVF